MLTQRDLYIKQQKGTGIVMDPDPMPPTKIRAFLEEFPWIRKHVEEPIVQVYVSGVESAILNYSLEGTTSGKIFGITCERIILLNEEGEEVTDEIKKLRKKFFFFGPVIKKVEKISGTVLRDSSVGAVAQRLGEKADLVRYLLSYYEYTQAVIVYKLPKNASLRQWIDGEVKSEGIKLRGEIATL
ncbi:MAG: hypothetical protein V1711_00795 [bacterium]